MLTRLIGAPDLGEDWIRAADAHALLPVVCGALDRADLLTTLPNSTREKLRAALIFNAHRSVALAAELSRILAAFEETGIPALPFKGPVLAAELYGSVSMRQFKDLDLLVPPSQVSPATELLSQLGYAPSLLLTSRALAALVRSRNALNFFHPDHGVTVDLQWQVTPSYFSFQLPVEELWASRRAAAFVGRTVFAFSPEDQLLVLCIHGAKHLWLRLGWVRDVAQLLANGMSPDWDAVLRRANARGGKRLLGLGLYLAQEYGGATLPPEVRQYVISDGQVPRLAEEISREFWKTVPERPGIGPTSWFLLRARERWRDRVRYCVRLASDLGPADLQADISPRLPVVPYLLRPLRLSAKYFRGLLNKRT
ncbi:MAG: nucleotidyltransferase family protein [Gemmatimonadales bacterium]